MKKVHRIKNSDIIGYCVLFAIVVGIAMFGIVGSINEPLHIAIIGCAIYIGIAAYLTAVFIKDIRNNLKNPCREYLNAHHYAIPFYPDSYCLPAYPGSRLDESFKRKRESELAEQAKINKTYGVHPTEIWAVGHPEMQAIPKLMDGIKNELLALHNQGINIYWSRQGLVYVAGQWVWTAYGVSNFSNWLCQFKKMREVFNYAPVKEGGEWGIEY